MAASRVLNQRQLEVLQWIGEGCPPRDWPDHTHKISARALQNRGLVAITRREGRWSAVLTERGQYYLEHGSYPPQPPDPVQGSPRPTPVTASGSRPRRGSRRPEISDLLEQVHAAGGVLRIADPNSELRAAYRRAIHAVNASGAVPDDHRLRYTGRDQGDLVIRLAKASELTDPAKRLPAIPVPETLDQLDDAVDQVLQGEKVSVSQEQRDRALLIVQAIADEARRRGHGFHHRPDGECGFRISIGEDSYDLTVREEYDKVESYPEEEIAAKRYPWQRVSAQQTRVASGRLAIELSGGSTPLRWADRKRWRLVDRLPKLFQQLEDRAEAARQARQEEREAARRRRERWEAAVGRAREAYLSALNRQRVIDQAENHRQAQELREYAATLSAHAERLADHQKRQDTLAWARWAHEQAERLDPLNSPDALVYLVPEEIEPEALDRHMPARMTAAHPPKDPAPR